MNKFKLLLFASFFPIFLHSCSDKKRQNDLDNEKYAEEKSRIIYRIPSPIEIFNLLQNAQLDFHEQVLNPLGNWENYNSLKSQALNMGIYSADLAYTAAYEQYQESLLYFNLIRKLGNKIGIGNVFSDEMAARVQNNLNNADSLSTISGAYYKGMIDYLTENRKTTELALIYTGGWVEALYILCNTIDTLGTNDQLMKELADQSLVAQNLEALLLLDTNVIEIRNAYTELSPLFDVFNEVEMLSSEEIQVATVGDEIVVKGGSVYSFDKAKCGNLKLLVNQIRSTWILK